IFENTSWSCAHGIERWRGNCGCSLRMSSGWTQIWRKPLREAMNDLNNRIVPLYEKEASKYLKNPWEARNDYVEVIMDRSNKTLNRFMERHKIKELSVEERIRVLKLLEIQRNAMLMFTSCGWFFDEISGIETKQVIQYSARAIQLAEELWNIPFEKDFLSILKNAPSNIPGLKNGSNIYRMFIKPTMFDLIRVGVHYAISSLFEEYPERLELFCYTARSNEYELIEAGKLRLAIGRVHILSKITREEKSISFAVLHMGDHNLNGGIGDFMDEKAFSTMKGEAKETFNKGDIPELIRIMDKHFGNNTYSLRHLFKDEKRKVLHQILLSTLEDIKVSFRLIYENNYTIMNFLHEAKMPFPKPLVASAEFILNTDLKEVIEGEKIDLERLERLIDRVNKWGITIDRPMLSLEASKMIGILMENFMLNSDNVKIIEDIEHTIGILRLLPLDLDLWNSQNIYFKIWQSIYEDMKGNADNGDEDAKGWLSAFSRLGVQLKIKAT
ncbi:MAG: DUF3536 domain-containing protein, partial [Thermodesulfobacteriota bacterium]|nr:DUF3536 domain-containing protein [Thermodesulfobacteriota bacterium]